MLSVASAMGRLQAVLLIIVLLAVSSVEGAPFASEPEKTSEVLVYGNYPENTCEIQSPECVSCYLILANTSIKAVNQVIDDASLDSSLRTRECDVKASFRWVCDQAMNPVCSAKPLVQISQRPNSLSQGAVMDPEGYEIIFDALDDRGRAIDQQFFELHMDHAKFAEIGLPNFTVDYFHGIKLVLGRTYRVDVYSLPKRQFDTTLSLNDRGSDLITVPKSIPHDLSDTLEWPLKEPKCSSKIWCYRGEHCHLDSDSEYGVISSLLIALLVSLTFLLFFLVIVVLARRRVAAIGDDTEHLEDYYEEELDEERQNETELKDLHISPSHNNNNVEADKPPQEGPNLVDTNVVITNGNIEEPAQQITTNENL